MTRIRRLSNAVLPLALFFWLTQCSRASLTGRLDPLSSPGDSHGYEVGNGGTVVVCRANGKTTSVELVDFFVARLKWRSPFFQPALGPSTWDVRSKIAKALSRLARLDRVRAAQYQSESDGFFGRSKFVTLKLPDTKDYGDIPVPSHCAVEQIVVHKVGTIPQEVDFLVAQPFWTSLNNDDQAGLVLHEVIYLDAIRHGQTTSIYTRAFTALIASNALDNYDAEDYQRELTKLHLQGSSDPAPVWPHDPWVLPYVACVGLPFHFDLKPYVNPSGNAPLSFSPGVIPHWLGISSAGELAGIPDSDSLGQQKVVLLAQSGEKRSQGELWFQVVDCLHAPPFTANTPLGQYFQFELPYLVGTRFYSRISGPSWLATSIGSAVVMGRPKDPDLGVNHFTFRLYLDSAPYTMDFDLLVTVTASNTNAIAARD